MAEIDLNNLKHIKTWTGLEYAKTSNTGRQEINVIADSFYPADNQNVLQGKIGVRYVESGLEKFKELVQLNFKTSRYFLKLTKVYRLDGSNIDKYANLDGYMLDKPISKPVGEFLEIENFTNSSVVRGKYRVKLYPDFAEFLAAVRYLFDAELYEFKMNTPPSISGKDESLGNVSDEINYNYTVFDEDNDTLSIVERLNNTVINVRNDVKSGSEFTLTIPKQDIYKLPIGQENKISIEVSDGQEKVYRNLTFVRTNTAPIIQVLSEKELGEIIAPFTTKIIVTDEEEDATNLVYTVNQIVLEKDNTYKRVAIHTDKKENIELGKELEYSIPLEVFKTMNVGDYELSIKAIDAEQGENEEIISFTRTEDTIDFTTRSIETETMPKQFISLIQIIGNPTNVKIMACNNGLDSSPAWEDITEFALNGSPYNFKNTTKTAAKWAVKAQVCLDGREVK